MQFSTLSALVAASSLSTGFLSVLAAPAPSVHVSSVSPNAFDSQNNLNPANPPIVHTTQGGQLSAHWSFVIHAGKEIDTLIVNFYDGGDNRPTNAPTCSDFWDITQLSLQGQLNGRGFAGPNCAAAGTPTYVIFDANRPGGPVSTYGSANGVNCGWQSSPDHFEVLPNTQYDDYYFSCSW